MTRVRFEIETEIPVADPQRTDIALFVGFARRRTEAGDAGDPVTTVPRAMTSWLERRGWVFDGDPANDRAVDAQLRDVPVPITSFDAFDHLYAWEEREYSSGVRGATYLGTAVRSFFSQGGKRCYVVAVADDGPPPATPDDRTSQLRALIPGYPDAPRSPARRNDWRGVWHLFALPDVTLVCLPDLCDAVRVLAPVEEVETTLSDVVEEFRECSSGETVPRDRRVVELEAPRSDLEGYALWADALDMLVALVRDDRRDGQIVASIPIPIRGLAEATVLADLSAQNHPSLDSAFLQLAYPWVRTLGSDLLPEQLEGPDAVLTGVLARNALSQGTFRSAVDAQVADAYDTAPQLSQADLDPGTTSLGFVDRVSLIGRTPSGIRVLSDVSRSLSPRYRPANVSRLVALIVRAARRVSESSVFEPSGETLWAGVRDHLERLMLGLWEAGALYGSTPRRAFEVRCDRSTMTQNDIDNGRLIATVRFDAAVPIERITVVFAMAGGGSVTVLSGQGQAQDAA